MKKAIKVLVSVFVILTSMYLPAFAQENEIDVETNLRIKEEVMLSGENNHINVEFKITGPKTVLEDFKFQLKYDSSVKIDENYLKNNIPSEFKYQILSDAIQFDIELMEAGKYYEIPIIFNVENGIVKNDTSLNFDLIDLSSNNPLILNSKSVLVNASSPLKINKDYIGLADKKLEDTLGIAPGLEGKWKTKAVIPKSSYGQMFIKQDSKISITELYDDETLEYVRTDGGIEPSQIKDGMLVWQFDAPTYENQHNSEYLFYKEFDVIYKVKEDLRIDTKLDNQGSEVTLEFTNIDDKVLIDSDEGRTSLYPSAEDTPEVEGNWWIPGHFGPTSAFGDFSIDFEAMNTRPTVYEWATLTYAHQIAALEYGEDNQYKNYDISYFINDHLVLEEIKTPGRFLYRPNREHGDATYLEEQPIFDVYFYDDSDNLLASFKNIEENQIITREEILGTTNNTTHIKKVVYSAVKFVPGMIVDEPDINEKTGFTDLPTYTFSIAPTWKNEAIDNMYELKNEKIIEVERMYPEGFKEIYDFREGAEYDYIMDSLDSSEKLFVGWHFLSAPRWAVVTEDEQTYIPTVKNSIELLDHKDGIVYPGENTLRVKLENKRVSLGAILPNVESYFILPKTIKVNLDGVSQNIQVYKNELDQYNDIYVVNWNNSVVTPRKELSLDLQVEVLDEIQSLNMFHYTKLTENEEYHVPVVEEPVLQDSYKVTLPKNLSQFINADEVVLTKNNYTVLSDYYIKTEKFVKTLKDDSYKKTTIMEQDDIVRFKLKFENKKGVEVNRFGLIDILPHIGDFGITNSINRGSEFDLSLNSAVVVDDRFDVLYSESKNPSRAILNDMVDKEGYLEVVGGENVEWMTEDEVKDWNKIFSFVVILKEDALINIDEIFELEFDTKIPGAEHVVDNRYAYNSFALTANGSPIVEPLQVSVKLESEEETPRLGENPPPLVPVKPIIPEEPTVSNKPINPVKSTPSNIPNTGVSNTMGHYVIMLLISTFIMIIKKYKKYIDY